MAKYIEKSKLEKEMLNWAVCLNNPDTLSRSDAMFIIDNVEAADVAPVVHGEWLCAETDDEQFFLCSVCNDKEYWESNYCPECGAKMDAEQEDPTNGKKHDS